MTQTMHQELKSHLHNGDGLEAIAFVLCGKTEQSGINYLLAHETYLLPYDNCMRTQDRVSWKTIDIEDILEKALLKNLSVIKIHSHFIQDSDFSSFDDISDKDFFESVFGWLDSDTPQASVIMYPDGALKGRIISSDIDFYSVKRFTIVGDDIKFYWETQNSKTPLVFERNSQAFGNHTTLILRDMKIGIIGVSGTGSPIAEMLMRLGAGTIVLADPDTVGQENLNRIISSRKTDAVDEKLKVDVLQSHINEVDIGTQVLTYPCAFQESEKALEELSTCDVIFGCVDSIEGRHYLNLISTAYLVPLIDVGVKLVADGKGNVDSIIGNIHYLTPGYQTLEERGVYSWDMLSAEVMKRIAKDEYENRRAYFENIEMSSPAVISVNSVYSSLAVNEMLGRIHMFRYSDNSRYRHTVINLTDWDLSSHPICATKDDWHLSNIGLGNSQSKTNEAII